jgi:hypothetical protein
MDTGNQIFHFSHLRKDSMLSSLLFLRKKKRKRKKKEKVDANM